ncbi:MAG TPA: hypothetical protein VII75_02735, partial [Thermoanaerobaculia bacterium]
YFEAVPLASTTGLATTAMMPSKRPSTPATGVEIRDHVDVQPDMRMTRDLLAVLLTALGLVALVSCGDATDLNQFRDAVLVESLRVRDDAGVRWEIKRVGAEVPLRRLKYGLVPQNFVQVVPTGTPSPFREGQKLSVAIVTDKTILCSRGIAVGPAAFRQNSYETVPINGTSPEWRRTVSRVEQCQP